MRILRSLRSEIQFILFVASAAFALCFTIVSSAILCIIANCTVFICVNDHSVTFMLSGVSSYVRTLRELRDFIRSLFTQQFWRELSQDLIDVVWHMVDVVVNVGHLRRSDLPPLLFRFIRRGWRILLWLFAPRTLLRLLTRHSVALVLFLAFYALWRLVVSNTVGKAMKTLWAMTFDADLLARKRDLARKMTLAQDYQQWADAGNELDRLEGPALCLPSFCDLYRVVFAGRFAWKDNPQSSIYDWRRIRDDLLALRQLVDAQDVLGIMRYVCVHCSFCCVRAVFCLLLLFSILFVVRFSRSRLLRNLVGISDARLYSVLRAGTKRLIEEYISEVCLL